jgi:hypothetical protein
MQRAGADAEKLGGALPVRREFLKCSPDDLLLNDPEGDAERNGDAPLRVLSGENR